MSDSLPRDCGTFVHEYRPGRAVHLRLVQSAYINNGRPAFVTFNKEGEPWAHLTVNLPDEELGEFEVVGNHNSPSSVRILDQHPAFTMTDRQVQSGFVTYNTWIFDPEKLGVSDG